MRLDYLFFVISMYCVLFGLSGCELFADEEGGDPIQMDETSTWVRIQAGRFEMGDAHMVSAGPIHTVSMRTFDVTRTEVTVADYANCVNAGFCSAPAMDEVGCNWNQPGFELHPVNCVDWHQAKAFCSWFGGRLLSEAEWEFAARSGGDGRAFPWGMDAPSCEFAVMADESGISGCGNGRTSQVCSKPDGRTDQGLCDMGGNVYEWVEDNFHITYDGNPPEDGTAWVDADATETSFRVLRGAGYTAESAEYLHVARRANDPATTYHDRYGIRCAKTVE